MSMSRRILRWFEARINLTEIFSFITTFGLAYGDIDTRKKLDEAVEEAFKRPLPAYAQWPHVLGLVAFLLFLFQVATGALLLFYYQPAPQSAYDSVLLIIRDTSLGWYIHQMHYWGTSVLLALLVFRLARFFLHGTYKAPRELIWICGMVLFLLGCHAALTGNLLPWDQQAYWSVTRSLEIIRSMPVFGHVLGFLVGGLDIRDAALTRFYLLHVVALPLAMLAFFYLHFATVRRIGLSPLAEGSASDPKPLYPNHLLNLLTIFLLLFGVILALAVLWPEVFRGPADPFVSPAGIRPPWYLLPAYGLIETLPAGVGGTVLLLSLLVFLGVPFLDRTPDKPVRRRPVALLLFAGTCLGLLLLSYMGYTLRG